MQKKAKKYASLLLESIIAMRDRLEHVGHCQDPRCNLSDKEILDGLYAREEGCRVATEAERIKYHDKKDAWNTILYSHLRAQAGGTLQYQIWFHYSGNHLARIRGGITEYYVPTFADFDYRSEFVPWTPYPLTKEERKAILEFASYCSLHFKGISNARPFQ